MKSGFVGERNSYWNLITQCVIFLRTYCIIPLFSYPSLLRSRHFGPDISVPTLRSRHLSDNRNFTVFILGTGSAFHLHKELARICSLKYTTSGECFFFTINEALAYLELGWEILTNIKTDGGCTYSSATGVTEGIGE
jgi:hypothetical protein